MTKSDFVVIERSAKLEFLRLTVGTPFFVPFLYYVIIVSLQGMSDTMSIRGLDIKKEKKKKQDVELVACMLFVAPSQITGMSRFRDFSSQLVHMMGSQLLSRTVWWVSRAAGYLETRPAKQESQDGDFSSQPLHMMDSQLLS